MKENIIKRYSDLQNTLKHLGATGCHFLCLCSIAEDYLDYDIDILEVIQVSKENNWIDSDFYVKDALAVLFYLTGVKWQRSSLLKKLPEKIADNQFTEVCYCKKDDENFTHFARRYVDTWANSNTVKYGKIKGYYVYTVEE